MERFSIFQSNYLIAVLALCGVSWWVSSAFAQSTTVLSGGSPEALIAEGLEFRQQGRDAEALERFEAAYRLSKSPRAQAQIALAHQALGHWVRAEQELLAALHAEADPWIRRHREPLERSLEAIRKHIGSLELVCNVPGASVRINGRDRGRTPLAPLRASTGSIVVNVSATGYFPITRTVTIAAGAQAREEFVLTPQGPAAGRALEQTDAQTLPIERTKPAIAPRNDEPRDSRSPRLRVAGWWMLAGAGLSAIASAVAWGVRERNLRTWNDDDRCAQDPGRSRDEECPGTASTWRRAQRYAIATAAATGVLAAIGAALLIRAKRLRTARHEIARARCGASPDLGLMCRWGAGALAHKRELFREPSAF